MAERFGPALRPAEIEMLLKGALNKNTKQATTAWLRAVTSQEREVFGHVLSSSALCQFYSSVRPQKTGVEYSSNHSYLAARVAIQRHLRVVKLSFVEDVADWCDRNHHVTFVGSRHVYLFAYLFSRKRTTHFRKSTCMYMVHWTHHLACSSLATTAL